MNLVNTITEKQLEWLDENIDAGYEVENTTITKYSTWAYLLIMQLIPDGNIASIIQLNNDGTTVGGGQRDVVTEGYWQRVYDGIEETNMYYYYINHGDNKVDSVETLGIPSFSTERYVIDIEDLVRVKDTKWKWLNLFKVLNNLTPDIEAIPTKASERQNLAYEWDSNMSWRIFSPYMQRWIKGELREDQIALYLKSQFGDKWNKLYDVMSTEYNALQPYNIHEVEHTDDAKNESRATSSESTSDNSGTSSNSTSATNEGQRYGFNSATAVDVDKDIVDNSQDGEYADDLHNVTEGSNTYLVDNDLDRELTRTGNTGNIMMQQLVDAEWETRKKIVLDTIRMDIIDTMTIPFYE